MHAPYNSIPATATTMPTSWTVDTLSPKNSQPPSSTSIVLACPSTCSQTDACVLSANYLHYLARAKLLALS